MTGLNKQNVIWGVLLIVFGVTAFFDVIFDIPVWAWILVLFFAGLFAGVVNWNERSNLANFIPTYVLWVIAGFILLIVSDILVDEAIPVYVLWAIAFPFILGFLRDRSQWGLLIPAYVLFAVGAMVGLIGLGWLNDLLIPAYVMFAIAIPFFTVFFRDRKNWWALIPAGIMSAIGLGFLLASPAIRLVVPLALIVIGAWVLIRTLMRK